MLDLKKEVSLASHTTFKTGGQAQYFVTVSNEEDLKEAVAFSKENNLPIFILGGGSNVLVSDAGFAGLVIKMSIQGTETKVEDQMVEITAGAGVILDDLVAETVAKNWWGLENLSHIPGSVGAAPVQNVGAYGVEVADLIKSVRVYDIEKEMFYDLLQAECSFGYRHSIFKEEAGKRFVITGVTFVLSTVPTPQLGYADLASRFVGVVPTAAAVREEIIAIRSQKFPDWQLVGTAGSFFKNPIIDQQHYDQLKIRYPELPGYSDKEGGVKVPIGWVLDKVVGVRGKREGQIGSYEGQALVLVNYGEASTADVLAFADELAQAVYDATGIEIEREVTLIE